MQIKTTFKTFDNVENLIKHFENNPLSESLILVKGSRGIHLEKIFDYL